MRLPKIAGTVYAVAILVAIGLALTYGAMEVSSTPAFCGSCHVMEPYFESWQTSNHADIACVDCHIPPGITAELRKKYEALAMVARYFTATYGTNPWTEVEDAACLECHERRLLAGSEVFGDVLFDHRPHLSELRRGKLLRCTSCHSQIVQGSHIAVTTTTCILCHFKDQAPGTETAACKLCHKVPQTVVDAGGLEFDHSDVSQFDMRCESCHPPPGVDAGRVPRERCVTCHNDPDRLAAFEEGDLLHRTHVSDHKVECTNCHLEIEHVSTRHLEAARTECSTCHGGRHSPQRDLYAGIGGKGVDPKPDVMYRAGVRCEGCHFDHGGGTQAGSPAGEVACMSCHGPGYRVLYSSWTKALASRTGAMRRQLDAAARLPGVGTAGALENARSNLELVERGNGIHNMPYALALLDASHRQVNEARVAAGYPQVALAWPTRSDDSGCLDCHLGAEVTTVRVFGRTFAHERHVNDGGIGCLDCHLSHEERDATGEDPLRLTSASCNRCHHGGRGAASSCASCHGSAFERSFATDIGEFEHRIHVGDMEMACSDCHGEAPRVTAADREVCTGCH